jgi:hypothetical protein
MVSDGGATEVGEVDQTLLGAADGGEITGGLFDGEKTEEHETGWDELETERNAPDLSAVGDVDANTDCITDKRPI